MSSTKMYSVEEVLSLTVSDIPPDLMDIEIEGWSDLTPEESDRCISKLRELKNQRDELAQTSAVDANALTDKLNQVERSRSATPYNPYNPNDPSEIAKDQKKDKESYEALIKDNGRPCYPIELGFDVFGTPGQYEDIIEYWQQDTGAWEKRLVFSAQLSRWKSFRNRQQRDRQYCVRYDWFPKLHEFLRNRRRKFGLDGDVHLCEVAADQSKLEDWMEYQNHELMKCERLEESLKKSQERLASNRKALAEEGYSAFEEIEDMEFGQYYSMNLDWHEREAKAKKKEELAERKLKIAKTRLGAAQSEEIGESVERDQWIGWFVKEVESQRTKVDELQRLAHEARRDVEPYDQWLEAKRKEWEEKGWDGWTEEGRRLIDFERSSAEYQTQFDKRQELNGRAHEAKMAHYCAGLEVEFAEELVETARTEDLAQTVERAALIRRTQKEVRFAEFHLAEEKESTKVLDLKTLRLDNLYSITGSNSSVKSWSATTPVPRKEAPQGGQQESAPESPVPLKHPVSTTR